MPKMCYHDQIETKIKIFFLNKVGDAFMKLLSDCRTGSVMCVWNKCPPYYIPDISMPLFIFFTTCAMIFRFIFA